LQIPEFRSLLRKMGGSDSDNLAFVQKVQQSLKLDQDSASSNLTFHVGVGKASIDLPSQTLDVSSAKDAGVKVLLTADSDGIEGEAMRRSSPPPPPPLTRKVYVRRGRPPKNRLQQQQAQEIQPILPLAPPPQLPTPPTIGTPTPSRFDGGVIESAVPAYLQCRGEIYGQQQQQQVPSSEGELARQVGLGEFFANSSTIETFKYHLNCLMANYECPREWLNNGIDPVVAMMVTRKQDQAYQDINFDAMLELYAKLTRFEYLQHQQRRQVEEQQQAVSQRQVLALQPQAMDLSRSREVEPDNRTYTELRTVRGKDSANEVLRHHQESQQSSTIPATESNIDQQSSSKIRVNEKRDSNRPRVKQEVLELPYTPQTVGPNDSVIPTSVYPAPPSVQIIADNLHGTDNGIVGEGNHVVTITYGKCNLGPIRLRSEQEVTLVTALAKERCETAKHRGKNILSSPQYYAKAVRARSLLRPDVVRYIDRAFTKKGLKENQVGRKRTNYPKRSMIIKLDPVTGEKIYPEGHPLHKNSKSAEVEIKQEAEDADNNVVVAVSTEPKSNSKNSSVTGARSPSSNDNRTTTTTEVQSDIDSILTLNATAAANMNIAIDDKCPPPTEQAGGLHKERLGAEKVNAEMTPEQSKRVTRNQTRKAEDVTNFQGQRAQRKRTSTGKAVTNKSSKKPQEATASATNLTVENLGMFQVAGKICDTVPLPVKQGPRKYRGYSTVAAKVTEESSPANTGDQSSSKKQNSILRNIEVILSRRAEQESSPGHPPSPKKATPAAKGTSGDDKRFVTRIQSRREAEESEVSSTGPRLISAKDKDEPPSAFSTVFVRHSQGNRIKRLLEKRERKKQQQLLKLSSSPSGPSSSTSDITVRDKAKYRGYGKQSEGTSTMATMSRRFSEAEDLGGVKKVIRNGQIITTPVEQPREPEPFQPPVEKKARKTAKTTREEQDLIAELFKIADNLVFSDDDDVNAATPPSFLIDTSSQGLEVADSAGSNTVNYTFPTFDDLM
jgi:hypothetical protein